MRVSSADGKAARQAHPNAEVLVHPECKPDVLTLADHLAYQCPEKRFYTLSKNLICPNMKATSLVDVYRVVSGKGVEEVFLDEETIKKARACIDRMIELG